MIMVLLLPALPYFFKLVPAVIFLPLIGVLVIYYFLSYHLQLVTRYNILISEKTDLAAELERLVKLRSEELEKTIQALYARSITDPLTGLFTRQHFHEVFDQLIEDKTPFGVLTFDYDKFKYINDTFGHGVGDELLTTVSQNIKNSLTKRSLLARLGGDEFGVIYNETDPQKLTRLSQALIDALEQPVNIQEYEFQAEASCGIAVYPDNATKRADLMRYVDQAMYEA